MSLKKCTCSCTCILIFMKNDRYGNYMCMSMLCNFLLHNLLYYLLAHIALLCILFFFGCEVFLWVLCSSALSWKLILWKCHRATPSFCPSGLFALIIALIIFMNRNFGAFLWKYFTAKINWYTVVIWDMTETHKWATPLFTNKLPRQNAICAYNVPRMIHLPPLVMHVL